MTYPVPVSDVVAALSALADREDLAAPIEQARQATTSLRWHPALRRRIPEAAAESRVRGAQASAELDGARMAVGVVRERMAGVRPWPEQLSADEVVLAGVVAATAESEAVASLVMSSPMQAMARLHTAAAARLLPADQVGRPRTGRESSPEFVDAGPQLGPAPAPREVSRRLALLRQVVAAGGQGRVPAVLVAAIVHAEIATVRPFVRGNGVVARAMERAVVRAAGLDPTGVAVPELGHFRAGLPAYAGALGAYAQGSAAGVGLWVHHCASAVQVAADEGVAIADAVLVGRLNSPG